MKKLYFGRDEKDVITIEPGGTSDRTVTSDGAMRPLFLCCAYDGRQITFREQLVDQDIARLRHITVESLRIGRDEQLTMSIPLATLLTFRAPLALETILPASSVYIKLVSAAKDRIECVLWLEGEELALMALDAAGELHRVESRSVIVGDGIGTCGTRSPAEHAAHLEHELHRAHSQRDIAIEALKRIAGPDGAAFPVRSQGIAEEALRKIHALRRPNATTRKGQ